MYSCLGSELSLVVGKSLKFLFSIVICILFHLCIIYKYKNNKDFVGIFFFEFYHFLLF